MKKIQISNKLLPVSKLSNEQLDAAMMAAENHDLDMMRDLYDHIIKRADVLAEFCRLYHDRNGHAFCI